MLLSDSQIFNLSATARDGLEAFVIQHRQDLVNRAGNAAGMHELLAREGHKLPDILFEAVARLSDSSGMFLLKNTAVVPKGHDIPGTPEGPNAVTDEIREAMLYAPTLALLDGIMSLRPQREANGRLRFNHVIPTGSLADREVFGTDRPLSFHIDGMAHLRVPEVGGIACVRGQEGSKTSFIDIEKLLASLDEGTLAALREPNFGFDGNLDLRRGSPFGQYSADFIEVPYSVLDGALLRYSQNTCGQTDAAEMALVTLRKAMGEAPKVDVALESGDVLFWRNDRYIHGRSAYEYLHGAAAMNNRWVIRQMSFLESLEA